MITTLFKSLYADVHCSDADWNKLEKFITLTVVLTPMQLSLTDGSSTLQGKSLRNFKRRSLKSEVPAVQILSMVISSAVAIGGLCILAASVFGLLDHGQKRAARRLSYLAAGYLIFWTVIIAVVVPHFWSVGIILSLPFLAVGVILCKPNSLGRQGPLPSPEPYDKRDTPFSRIRLKPGTAEYEEY